MRVLVMAKAPVPGLAKTRLAAAVGDEAAADLAAAALLDTISACREATADCSIALTGVLEDAFRAEEIRAALAGWSILWQRGEAFAERLANAHLDAGPGPLLQIGTDTPQVTAAQLRAVADVLTNHDTVLGPADDGGWWVLGRHDAAQAEALRGVPMSTSTTGDDTRAALVAHGLSVGLAESLRDVDTVEDTEVVAAAAPGTRFARAWVATGARS
jgi:rSAM/selenodomain-associated transferase 1